MSLLSCSINTHLRKNILNYSILNSILLEPSNVCLYLIIVLITSKQYPKVGGGGPEVLVAPGEPGIVALQ